MSFLVMVYEFDEGEELFDRLPGLDPLVIESGDLPGFSDLDYPMLRLIDPYGHTFLSEYQLRAALSELERFSTVRSSPRLTELIALARRVESRGGHRYLAFHGD